MCEEYGMYTLYTQEKMDKENAQRDSFHHGFMTQALPTVIFPKDNRRYSFRPYPVNGEAIHTRIANAVTAAEYAVLTSVNVNSSKDDIVSFVTILQRLLDQGVFDEDEKITPDKPVQYGGMPAPFMPNTPYFYGGIQPMYGAPTDGMMTSNPWLNGAPGASDQSINIIDDIDKVFKESKTITKETNNEESPVKTEEEKSE